ncbi:MAG: YvcK family protein [SAR202 cluster bacterium]|nr:YvcK family protein [SAR202 cluster bacterium]
MEGYLNGGTNGHSKGGSSRGAGKSALMKFLYVGLGVKRWLLIGSIGVAVCSVGLAVVLKNVLAIRLPDVLPWYSEGMVVGLLGVVLVLAALYGLYWSAGPLLFASKSIEVLTDTLYTRRFRGRGARIAAIGGGTGLSVLLRGLKAYSENISAIVTVADDGGSSGRLRRELGVLPPGDFRNCLVALSDDETLLRELFQYRFSQGQGLEGHSFGNLFIAAMTNITGSFEQALIESSRVLAVRGKIMPATMANLSLSARMRDGSILHGESKIGSSDGAIERIMINPQNPEPHLEALRAIEEAQLIVVGPGSLYTSILPNLLVPEICRAIQHSRAKKVYVCNVATQKGETFGYSVADHVEALQAHTFPAVVDFVIANNRQVELGQQFLGQPVTNDGRSLKHVRVVASDLVDATHPVRHDSTKLAQAIMDVYTGKHIDVVSTRAAAQAAAAKTRELAEAKR